MEKRWRRWLGLPLALSLLAVPSAQAAEGEEPEFQGYIVQLADQSDRIATMSAELSDSMEAIPFGYYTVDTLEELQALEAAGLVQHAEKNYKLELLDTPNDPYYTNSANHQFNLDMIGLSAAWETQLDGSGVKVGIIDSGLIQGHEDMDYTSDHIYWEYDYYDMDSDVSDEYSNCHGSGVAGIIGATTNNRLGMVGVAPKAQLAILKCFGTNAEGGSVANMVAAIDGAIAQGCDVLNMSVGIFKESDSLKTAIDRARDAGIILVASAGNGDTKEPQGSSIKFTKYCYPASYDGVISVAAVDKNETRANFSQYNDKVDVTAPGVGILMLHCTTSNVDGEVQTKNDYATNEGTSFSTPTVTGVIALLKQLKPDLTYDDVMTLLEFTSKDLGTEGYDNQYGHGLIQVPALIQALTTSIAAQETDDGVQVTANYILEDGVEAESLLVMAVGYDQAGKVMATDVALAEVNALGSVWVDDFLLEASEMPTTIKAMFLRPTTYQPVTQTLILES